MVIKKYFGKWSEKLMKKVIILSSVLCVLGVFSYMLVVKEVVPDTTTDLIEDIESYISDEKRDIEPWLISKAHFVLARAYSNTGNKKKTKKHLSKITEVRDSRSLLRPVMDGALYAIRKNDIDELSSIIKNSEKHLEWITSIRYSKDTYDPEKGSVIGLPIRNTRWVRSTLCDISAKKLAIKKEYKSLIRLGEMDQCKETQLKILQYMIASLIRNQDYIKAYKLVELTKPKINLGNRFEMCLPKENLSSGKAQEFKEFLINQRKKSSEVENRDITIVQLLRILGYYDEALEVAKQIKDPNVRGAVLPIFEHYYRIGNREKTLEIVKYMDTYNLEPILTGGWGSKHPRQWWVLPIAEGQIIAQYPSSFGMDIALNIKNDKARFTVMKDIYISLKGTEEKGYFPNCSDSSHSCIVNELVQIAENETDEWDKDTMYGFLSEMERIQGNNSRSKEFISKIKNSKRMQCAFDMCSSKTVISLRLKSEVKNKKPSLLDTLFSNELKFDLIPTENEVLAQSLKKLSVYLNETSQDYKDVSSQSAYRIGYLSKRPIDISPYRQVQPCEID